MDVCLSWAFRRAHCFCHSEGPAGTDGSSLTTSHRGSDVSKAKCYFFVTSTVLSKCIYMQIFSVYSFV